MIAVLFAVALLGGRELPILHAPQFAEAHAFVHQHMDSTLGGDYHHEDMQADATHDHATQDQNSGDRDSGDHHPGSDHGCTHVHAHCCGATAILVTVETAPALTGVRQLRLARNGAIAYGQLSNPPLRPPRFAA
jgi:hypothetical protein